MFSAVKYLVNHLGILGVLVFLVVLASVSSGNVALAAQECAESCPGLVSWWRADGNADDAISGNHGTLEGGASFADGKVGQAFSFDGVDDFINVPDSASLDSITSEITVAMWINRQIREDPPTGGWIFSRKDPMVSEGFSLIVDNDGELAVAVRTTMSNSNSDGDSVFFSSPGVVTLGQFQHIAATWDTNTGLVQAYVNGEEVPLSIALGEGFMSGSLFNVDHLFIGRRQSLDAGEGVEGAAHYKGLIDEVQVYSVELTQAEIEAIYEAGKNGKYKKDKN